MFRGQFCKVCELLVVLSRTEEMLKCFLSITVDSSACTERQDLGGFKCVDVGNRGESNKRVTEGGQECEQCMLGNQQVLSCICVNPSLQ